MEALQKQYAELLASQQFREEDLDPAALDRHIAVLSTSALLSGCAVSVFGLHRGTRLRVGVSSGSFQRSAGRVCGGRIHPDDEYEHDTTLCEDLRGEHQP